MEEAGYHGYEGLDLIGDIVQGSDEVVGDIREAYNRAVSEVKAMSGPLWMKLLQSPTESKRNLN